LLVVGWVTYMLGEDRGYQEGKDFGRLDQHWYQKGVEQKARKK